MSLSFAVSSFVALFIIVDPIANVPLFVSILSNFPAASRRAMIARANVIAALVLLAFTFLGSVMLRSLGVEVYSFKIAGGILLFIISFEMLFGRRTATETSAEEEIEAKHREDVIATPLAVPFLTGPGAITTGIVLFNSAPGLVELAILIAVILLVFLSSYVILTRSERIYGVLGEIGTKVITRIMGLVLAALAVQFVITGIFEAMGAALP